jgi:hypothetical protein
MVRVPEECCNSRSLAQVQFSSQLAWHQQDIRLAAHAISQHDLLQYDLVLQFIRIEECVEDADISVLQVHDLSKEAQCQGRRS